jgi:hypothetical protein
MWVKEIKFFLYYPMKLYGRMEVQFHGFLTPALDEGKWSPSYPGHFTLRERDAGLQWTGGWVDPRSSLNAVEKRKFSCLCWELNGCPCHYTE